MTDTDRIETMLASANEEERLQALRLLEQQPGDAPVEWVFRALGDASWRVRKEAVELFWTLPRPAELAGKLVRLLHSQDNAGLRNAAMEILIRLGRDALSPLLTELRCDDHDVRKFALDILGEIGDLSCVPEMIEALDDPDENVRFAAAENLGKLRAAGAVPRLLDAMDSPNLWFRFTILEALGAIGERVPMARLLPFKEERLLRKALFDCLGRIGSPEAIPALVEGLLDEMQNVRESAALALVDLARRFPEQVREGLGRGEGDPAGAVAELLDQDNGRLKEAGIRLLGWLGDVRFASRLLHLMGNEELGEQAVHALQAMGPEAVSHLVRQGGGADERTQAYLAYLIGEAGCREGIDLLLRGLCAAEDDLRLAATQSLGKLGLAEAIGPLIGRLKDEREEIRQGAMLALCRLGSQHRETALRKLAPLVEAEDAELRMYAVSILGRLAGPEAEKSLLLALKDESSLVRAAAVRSLDALRGENALQALMLTLTDEDAEVRAQAAEVLGRTADPAAVEPLALALRDENIWVRSAAVRSLGLLGGEKAFTLVRQAAADPVGLVTIVALETLQEMDAARSLNILLAALAHEDEEVVKAAMQMLTRSGEREWIGQVREQLINHPHWDVRLTFVRVLMELEGEKCRPMLEKRLRVEEENLVRQQIQEFLLQPSDGQR